MLTIPISSGSCVLKMRNSPMPLRNVNILLIEIQGNEREDRKCRVTI